VARENVGPWKRCVLEEKTRQTTGCCLKVKMGGEWFLGKEMGLGDDLALGRGFGMVGR
jgi:hypothetical protein